MRNHISKAPSSLFVTYCATSGAQHDFGIVKFASIQKIYQFLFSIW
ncbi:hypothetical protein A2U01_0101069, partial [Trifolium medium]|nr:hypothetical protein [Trifolium medium]